MAYIRSYETTAKRKGKPVKRYEVVWREEHPAQPGKVRARQESYPTRELAEARRDELNNAKHSVGGTAALADAKKAGAQPFRFYAASWLDAQAAAVATGTLKDATAAKYRRLLEVYVLPELGGTPVAAINAAECRRFRAAMVKRPCRVGGEGSRLSAGTIKHIWAVFRAVLDLALEDGAIARNYAAPTKRRKRGTGPKAKLKHHPLNIEQLGALCAALAGQPATGTASEDGTAPALPAYPVYALMVEFMAATGLRASEVAGLEVADLVRYPVPAGAPPRMDVKVARTKERKRGAWALGTTKSTSSYMRSVPLPGWLAGRMADYLGLGTAGAHHPHADEPTAPLWPGRSATVVARVGKRRQTAHNWDEPVDMPTFYRRVFRPALLAAGLPASEPATPATKTTPAMPARHGVRLHDLRHTFAALQLSAGESVVKVSQWLGHADPGVTMTVYAAYVTEKPVANLLPEPTRPKANATPATNVVPLVG
jgi:integrase